MSRDFELGTNVSCKESTVSPRTGLILNIFKLYGDALDIKFNSLKSQLITFGCENPN